MPTIKKRDSRHRRIRYAERQPREGRISITKDDLEIFRVLQRHDKLASNYLYAYFPERNQNSFSDRLTALFHGAENGYFLEKPFGQFNSIYADRQHLVYENADKAQSLVDSKPTRVDNNTVHAIANGCVGASLELMLGEKYIHRHDILAIKSSEMVIKIGDKKLIPDDLFGIDYGGAFRCFAREMDRATESVNRSDASQTSLDQKLRHYYEVMKYPGKDKPFLYKATWGINTFMVAITTTEEGQRDRMMRKLLELDKEIQPLSDRFIFKVYPVFGKAWRVPQDILRDILDPWESTTGPFDVTKAEDTRPRLSRG